MKTTKIYLSTLLSLALIVSVSSLIGGCEKDDDNDDGSSLYQKLGERAGIDKAVEKSILAIASDPVLTPFFEVVLVDEGGSGPGLDALKENIADFVDASSGGPATYNGLSMEAAHAPTNPRMTNADNITNEVFDAFLNAMIQGAKDAGISDESILTEYRNLLEQSRNAIV